MSPVAVAMSGGVDSSAAAVLLGRQGYDLLGVTLRLHECAGSEAEDAARVAAQLGFAHHTVDLSGEFCRRVKDPFAADYRQGRTPNPCIACNRHIKFGALLDRVLELGADRLATGHYARIERDGGSGRWLLKTALHPEKDQSYVLYCLNQHQLGHTLFPLGGLSKQEIRDLAAQSGLITAHKGDSQDICFIPDGDYARFICRYTGQNPVPGDFVSPDGRVLGQHEGVIRYTLGQRRGIGVSSANGRLYVTDICPAENKVTLSGPEDLMATTLEATDLNFIPFDKMDKPVRVQAKSRYRQPAQPAVAEQIGPDRLRVTFDAPQRAMTPGQAVVLYDGDVVLGGGTIHSVTK
ncbi:MAG: tRNA 2-thiouridine(34) synthase MnmA [Oscillospiraceae bacterium]|nr:tRNA 2-thiouridine(34) synthase MnmA [Oscillospiraceae bacterium]